jgi:hypothetical protein
VAARDLGAATIEESLVMPGKQAKVVTHAMLSSTGAL